MVRRVDVVMILNRKDSSDMKYRETAIDLITKNFGYDLFNRKTSMKARK